MLENYFKITWKVLGRNKFFTFVSLFGITFTIGILLVLTTFYDNMLGPGYPEVNRSRTLLLNMVSLHTEDYSSNKMNPVGLHFIEKYIKHLQSPEVISFASIGEETTTFVGDKKLSLYLKHTDANFWKTNQFEFTEGLPYNELQVEQSQQVAIITETTRKDYFGEESEVIGKRLETGNKTYTVIGVVKDVPGNFVYSYGDMYVPYTIKNLDITEVSFTGDFIVALQAAKGADFDKIREEMDHLVSRIQIPADWQYTKLNARPMTLMETISTAFSRYDDEPPVTALTIGLFVAMFLFMLLPAMNLINLNSSRILERASEIGVRKAFGASSKTLATQFIIENVILTLLGGIFGFIFSVLILNWVESLELIPHAHLYFDYKVFFVAVALCVFFGVLSGVLPALRMSKIHIVHALKGQNL
ncbi:MAG: ABC transporter permease [Bacteroidota bacterium]